MLFDRKLAEQVCREMGVVFHPEQSGVLIGGKKLPNEFCIDKLFRGEYDDNYFDYEERLSDIPASIDGMTENVYREFVCVNQEAALAA